ncbi:MAG: thioredoxin family protein [Alphaproteobacteria bacterium]|nr:thioredoxin family protein [Alphaproteobacteria bacterium]MBU0858964.1 thioredoxin family protein [Alphaproteobacteria bacterium]
MLKKFVMMAALCAAVMLPAAAHANPEIGQPAPAFTGTDSNGKTHNLSDFKGKTVVLEWHNDGCPYVEKYYGTGAMQAVQKAAVDDGVVWLTINSGAEGKQGYHDAAATNELIAKQKSAETARILDMDGVIGKAYNAKTTPHMFVINGEGTLVYMGAIDDRPTADKADLEGATNYVTAALDEIKAGKPVSTPMTQPYGCGVKYKDMM